MNIPSNELGKSDSEGTNEKTSSLAERELAIHADLPPESTKETDNSKKDQREICPALNELQKLRSAVMEIKDALEQRSSESLLRDVMLLCDKIVDYMRRIDGSLLSPETGQKPNVGKMLRWTRDRILENLRLESLDILDRAGVVEVRQHGDHFNPKCQRAIDIRKTNDPDEDGKVLKVLRPGFQYGDGKLLREADVLVARFMASKVRKEQKDV